MRCRAAATDACCDTACSTQSRWARWPAEIARQCGLHRSGQLSPRCGSWKPLSAAQAAFVHARRPSGRALHMTAILLHSSPMPWRDRARVRGSMDDAVSAARPQPAGGARRAADRTQREPCCRPLCLSQSATSSALGRLRDYFGDDLLVVKGRQMVLTSRAEELVEPVRAVLEQIRTTISVSPNLIPPRRTASSASWPRIISTDVLLAGPSSMICRPKRPTCASKFKRCLNAVRNARTRLYRSADHNRLCHFTDHPSQILFEDDYVVVGWSQNPAMAGPMTTRSLF
jgi:hypothetical protein